MPRIPRVRGLQSLHSAIAPPSPSSRIPFAAASRAISTTAVARGRNTEWVRGKLWKGEAPGPEDPYTQRLEQEDPSNLPEEALQHRPRADRLPRAVQESSLSLPPRRSEATAEKEVQAVDPSYVPAMTSEGLEEIAPLKQWWNQEGHWDINSNFRGFGKPVKADQKEVLEVHLRRAFVEVLALKEAGVLSEWVTKPWLEFGREYLDKALALEIEVTDGQASLKGDASQMVKELTSEPSLEQIAEEAQAVNQIVSVEEAQQIVKAWNPVWKTVALDDQTKFALRKRLYQLSGTLVPDAKLAAAKSVKHVLSLAGKKPQSPKLAEELEHRGNLQKLGNVKVHSRKIGPVEKETSVGRWKLIEEELKKRDLPVLGTAGLRRNKEKDWVLGNL